MLFLLDVDLVGEGDGDGERGEAGDDTGDGRGRGAFSSCSISFSSFISPGGSTLYLKYGRQNIVFLLVKYSKKENHRNGLFPHTKE